MPFVIPAPARNTARIGLGVAAGCAAFVLAWSCVGVNLARGCAVEDAPYLDLCPGAPTPESLRERIGRNPGDSAAYVQLALIDRSPARPRYVGSAAQLAPNDGNVLLMQAGAALDRQDWPHAVEPLVRLTNFRENTNASQVLARLIAGGQGELLFPHVTPGSHWLPRALGELPALKAPFSAVLPLLARALKAGVLSPDDARVYLRQLKSAGDWLDAYSLWVSLHEGPIPALYNGSFEEPFDPDGFDWEPAIATRASRAGAIVERRGSDKHGAVLDIRFTGRALPVPLVRQYLFIGEGRYRLRGEYMAHQLRMEQGLAWNVQCTGVAASAGRTGALGDTGGSWEPFTLDISVPSDCGAVTSLQLETFAPFEAALGARGRVAFDALSLEKLGR
ncbi:MAG: hypothetical protein ACXWJM_10260 [Ramlibacter sp.]